MADKRQPDASTPAIENTLGFDQHGDTFVVHTPQVHCCNCGTTAGLSAIPTHYVQASRFSTNYDDRLSFDLALPYCKRCSARVGKYPSWGVLKIVAGFSLWLMLSLGLAIAAPHPAPSILRILILLTPIFIVVGFFRWLNRPSAPMTAKYFPVKVREFSGHPRAVRYVGLSAFILSGLAYIVGLIVHKATGKNPHAIDVLSISFSNPIYGRAFAKANSERLRQGTMRIKDLPAHQAGGKKERDAHRTKDGPEKTAANDASRAPQQQGRPAPQKLPQKPLNFADFSAWFAANAQAYCDWYDGEESGDDLTLTTQIRRISVRQVESSANFELSLATLTTIKYHAAPATPNLNDKGMEALAAINAMRDDAGGTQNTTWWLRFAPDTQHGTAGWRFLGGEVQDEGTAARETIQNAEWIMKAMTQLDLPQGKHYQWDVHQVGTMAIVGTKKAH